MGYVRILVEQEFMRHAEDNYGIEKWLDTDPFTARREAIIKVPDGHGSDAPEDAPQADVWFSNDPATKKMKVEKVTIHG